MTIWWQRLLSHRLELSWSAALLLSVACVAVATVARLLLGAVFGPTLQFATYFPAVLVASLFGGAVAGLVSIPLSIMAVWWAILAPVYVFGPLRPMDYANFTLFTLASLLIVWLAASHRRALHRLEQNEQERMLLVGEVTHRSRNIITVVSSLIQQTIKDSDIAATLINRIRVVTDTNAIMDPDTETIGTLRGIFVEQLQQPHGPERISLTGPEVVVDGAKTRALRLVVHEMATNALKHGALSEARGRIEIDWKTDGQVLQIDWCERDGPKVKPPDKYNFGSRLILRTLKQLKAEFEPTFAETGYCYRMKVPLANANGERRSGKQ